MKFAKCLRTPFFYRTPAVAASGDGSFIFSKFRRYVFFKKIEHHSPGIFATILKKLYSRNALRGTHTFGGVQKIAPEENCPPVRVRVWFRISVRIGAGGRQFS